MTADGVRALRPARIALLALLALWAVGPLTLMIIHSLRVGVSLTGADGPVAPDVLQYLAWVRDAGSHGLAANLFDLRSHTHVWLHPMFSLSGLAVALGAGVIAAYLAWTPVAVGAIFAATAVWVRELVGSRPARFAALALALFLNNPLRALVDTNAPGLSHFDSQLVQATSEPFSAGLLWGYLPTVVAIALMPVCLVATAKALATRDTGGARSPRPRPLAAATLAALGAAWLHPWQGVVLILILAGAWAWERRRSEAWLALPVVGAVLPLAYYAALGHYDAAWHLSRSVTDHFPHFSAGVLLLALGPLLVLAATGLRRSGGDLLERSLVLWPVAAVVSYFVLPYPSHALEGISLPLAVLSVRGWQRVVGRSERLRSGRPAAAIAALAVCAMTLPGIAVDARDFNNLARAAPEYFYLQPDERRALDYVRSSAPAGGVVAPLPLATAIPARTDRAVWVGHGYWTPDFDRRATAVQALFAGVLPARDARALIATVREQGARLLVSGCEQRVALTRLLRPQVRDVRRFRCAAVYLL